MLLYVKKPHTQHVYLACLGGGVEGRSVEWGPLLALVPLLEGDTHHRGRGRGGEGEVKNKMHVKEWK